MWDPRGRVVSGHRPGWQQKQDRNPALPSTGGRRSSILWCNLTGSPGNLLLPSGIVCDICGCRRTHYLSPWMAPAPTIPAGAATSPLPRPAPRSQPHLLWTGWRWPHSRWFRGPRWPTPHIGSPAAGPVPSTGSGEAAAGRWSSHLPHPPGRTSREWNRLWLEVGSTPRRPRCRRHLELGYAWAHQWLNEEEPIEK